MPRITYAQAPDKPHQAVDVISTGWRSRLLISKGEHGQPLSILANAITALTYAPEWSGVLAFNESTHAATIRSTIPWDDCSTFPRCWTDDDDVRAAAWLQHQGILVGREIAGQAADTVARDHRFHPIRDYLTSLQWDGCERLNYWLYGSLGVEFTPYVAAVGSKFLIAAVARVMKPGCKADNCLILEGPQGKLKSTALRTLTEPWFTDELSDLGSKDAAMQLCGVWLVELAELDAMQRAMNSRVKAFLSRSADRYRPPYARRVEEVPRECVFAGTVNPKTYLTDETGGRRFWPVRVGEINIDALRADRDQLWAEAVQRYHAGECWWLDTKELVDLALAEQSARYDADPWQELISTYVEGKDSVSSDEVLEYCIRKPLAEREQKDKNRVARCLCALGFERYKQRIGEKLTWRYRRDRS